MTKEKKPVLALDRPLGKALQRVINKLRKAQHNRFDSWQFMAYAMGRARESNSQILQDLWVAWMLEEKRGGFFVEMGAGDGVYLSNTLDLERRFGWTGILAEPNPTFAEGLRRRPCIVSPLCVSGRTGDRVEFVVAERGELSHMAGVGAAEGRRIEVETITLNDLLERHGAPATIDYLSLDTEGAELEILSAFDFDRWDLRTLTVEHNYSPQREEVLGLLEARGYQRVFTEISMFDDWYVKA